MLVSAKVLTITAVILAWKFPYACLAILQLRREVFPFRCSMFPDFPKFWSLSFQNFLLRLPSPQGTVIQSRIGAKGELVNFLLNLVRRRRKADNILSLESRFVRRSWSFHSGLHPLLRLVCWRHSHAFWEKQSGDLTLQAVMCGWLVLLALKIPELPLSHGIRAQIIHRPLCLLGPGPDK
jgi:hypothetical protein